MRRWLPLLPALLITVGLFGGGLLLSVVQSLGYAPALGQTALNVDAYRALLADHTFWASLGLTAWVATISTALAAVFGTGLALLLHRAGRAAPGHAARLRFLAGLTLPIPHLVAAILTLLLLSQSGLLSRLTLAAGLTQGPQDFPALLYDPRGVGIILELVWKETPFIALNVLAVLSGLDPRLQDVARSLGAGRWSRFTGITLPLVRPALLSSGVLVFAYTLASFEVPALLGATSPTTLPVLAYRAFTDADLNARATAMALSVVIALLGGLLVWAYVRAQAAGRLR
ncbi:putative spermidine/putrescine transport system permease protein [Deinococcus metalli]|uniref:ABC transporter n=1 Tax=Deinococcus metalli TaxID=1141878 RepID=A0A7W8KJS2_9DEIO|nr:ABC transporter permease subunit [Deinococcus metalli]MBB5379215.1 putative spermidine/putrescine transport system permease protein [Deinococcus metalli]GHF65486.1 ABC transporter [Deinococcus metalli]